MLDPKKLVNNGHKLIKKYNVASPIATKYNQATINLVPRIFPISVFLVPEEASTGFNKFSGCLPARLHRPALAAC